LKILFIIIILFKCNYKPTYHKNKKVKETCINAYSIIKDDNSEYIKLEGNLISCDEINKE
jgi:hypothetical protein